MSIPKSSLSLRETSNARASIVVDDDSAPTMLACGLDEAAVELPAWWPIDEKLCLSCGSYRGRSAFSSQWYRDHKPVSGAESFFPPQLEWTARTVASRNRIDELQSAFQLVGRSISVWRISCLHWKEGTTFQFDNTADGSLRGQRGRTGTKTTVQTSIEMMVLFTMEAGHKARPCQSIRILGS